jgi:hypothetical protein
MPDPMSSSFEFARYRLTQMTFALWSCEKNLLKSGQERAKGLQSVGRSLQHNDGEGELRDILLKGQIAVNARRHRIVFGLVLITRHS